MALVICCNHSEDSFPLPPAVRAVYGPFGFPPPPPDRPHIVGNFAQTLDGIVSFADVPEETGGAAIARSAEDRWIGDLLRAHCHALLLGAGTLRAEPGPDGRGWDYGALPPDWLAYRRQQLGRERSLVVVATRSGALDLGHRLFHSPLTEALIVTTAAGAQRLRRAPGAPAGLETVALDGDAVAPAALARYLRRERGVLTLLCEAGPALYFQFFAAGLMDEDFRTLALQVAGEAAPGGPPRPTAYGALHFTPATAPWQRLISLHYAPPFHLFLRLRAAGLRPPGSTLVK